MAPQWESRDIDHNSKMKKAVTSYGTQSPYIKEIVDGFTNHYGTLVPEDGKFFVDPYCLLGNIYNEVCGLMICVPHKSQKMLTGHTN